MRYPPHLLDEIRARLSVSQVVSRKVALKRAGREFRGLSPFKVEKTPSFFVNDQKGFYHCFASGEHGDVFAFLMKTEGLSFTEAVERLAGEAGVPLPKAGPREKAREEVRSKLYDLLEASAAFFEASLAAPVGSEARRYISGRGLARHTLAEFRIGYAPNSRHALKDHLASRGFTVADMVEAGMLIGGEDIPQPYDRFRNRVMFPILDLKGRVIAFGGRALAKDERAKYLNSPETPLFHKGALLFNAARARPLAFERSRIIVVEGYMDVISLAEAGFGESVAPLGTALTEDQLQLLWRIVPEPTLCFDGDSAGIKAAHRAIDVILPNLKPGVSANIAFLPDGLDPDDLIRQEGPDAMQGVLDRARPMADVLWEREFGSGDWSTPERRARLEQQLARLVERIGDPAVRAHYGSAMREHLARAWGTVERSPWQPGFQNGGFRQGGERNGNRGGDRDWRSVASASQGRGGQPRNGAPRNGFGRGERRFPFEQPRLGAGQSLKARLSGEGSRPNTREILLLRTLINHPFMIETEAEAIAALELESGALARLRDALLALLSDNISLDREGVRNHLERLSLSKVVDFVERAVTHRSDRFSEPGTDAVEVEKGWRHTLALHERQTGLRKALAAAEQVWSQEGSEDALARIVEIKRLMASSETLELPSD